jgi:transcriptional regulator with XRE-family HTH domain
MMVPDRACPVKSAVYCGTMTQPTWTERLTRAIAGEIFRYRKDKGMSAQQLSDRCAKLGLEISRSTLADLENGRRATLTVAELLALAAALGISPTLLVAPVGRQEMIEILPGRGVAPWDVVRWLDGEVQLRGMADGIGPVDNPDAEADPLLLFRTHRALVVRWTGAQRAFVEPSGQRDEWIAEVHQELAEDFRRVRSRMRKLELIPPPLPREFSYLEQEPTS